MTTFRISVLTTVFIIMIALTGVNLTFSNTIGETCGIIHPYIFQTQVSIVDPTTGRDWSSVSGIPTSAGDQLDAYLRIYDENDRLLAQNDDYEDANAGIIDFKVSKARTVTIEVATFDDASQGYYKLQVEDTPQDLSELYPEITVGSTINGEIKANSRNSYLLNLTANEKVSIMLHGVDTDGFDLDTQLRVYNESRQMMNENDDYGDSYGSGIAPFVVSEDSSVILEVATYDDSEEGSYQLAVEPYLASSSENESRSEQDSANVEIVEGNAISPNQSLLETIQADTRVQHTLNLAANQLVDIYLESDLDTNLHIYNQAGLLLAENDDFDGLNAGLSGFSVPVDSTIIIVVGTYDDSEEGAYQLFVDESSMQINQADTIAIGDSLTADIASDTRNHHMFDLESGQIVNIYLEGDLDTYLRLYDISGRLIQENDDLNGFNAGISNFSMETAGTIIIEVATRNDTEEGQYQLTVEESNLQLSEGGSLIIGNSVSGDMLANNRIRYRLDLLAGQVVSITMTANNSNGDAMHSYLRIYDERGQVLLDSANETDLNAIIPRFDALDDMTVIVEASGYNDAEDGTYQLTVEEFQADTIPGSTLHVGSSISNFIEEGQRVQHRLDLDAGQAVIILLDGELDTYLRIYDEAGNLLADNDDLIGSNAGIVDFNMDTPSTVTVEVASFTDAYSGEYGLTVEPYSLAFAQAFFELDVITGDDISPDTTIRGEINPGQRFLHNLNLRAGQLVNIYLTGEDLDAYLLDTYLRIYDENGNVLAENNDFDIPNSGLLSFTVPKNMTVTIEVSTYGDDKAGDYELTVETNNIQINSAGKITIGDTVTGIIKTQQRIRYQVDLEPNRSISIFLSHDDSQSGVSVTDLSRYIQGNANEWVSCLEYYGYIVDTAYVINKDGLGEFVYGSKLEGLCDLQSEDCQWSAQITLTAFGKFLFYVILPGLAIILPIITVFMLKGDWELLWFISLILVALYVLTSALLYVHLGTVSGIVALSEFAYGMFGGTATGAAIAFMTKVMDNFSIDQHG